MHIYVIWKMSYNYAINQIMILCEKINQKCNTKIQCNTKIYYIYLNKIIFE